MVLDADAIHAVGKQKAVCTGKSIVFTPHDFEFFALTGITSKGTVGEERYELVKKGAQDLCAIIILKGAEDIISDGNEVAVNKTGNAYMTKGGTGDVLAGICGSLIAQGVSPFKAACVAAYISGRAGDIAASRKKQSLLASDVMEAISEAING
jgi:NAD(P)H-hydrate epimerase